MKQLIYIRLREEPSFEFGVDEKFKQVYSNIFDLDNFSDIQTVNYALSFFKDSDTKVIIDTKGKAQFGKLLYLFNELKKEDSLEFEIIGYHPMLGFLMK